MNGIVLSGQPSSVKNKVNKYSNPINTGNMEANKALNLVAGMCGNKEYCSRDIREKLQKWEISENETERIIGFLYKNKFLDDHRFAFSYANDKFKFNKWGKQKIAGMLRQKGIPSEIITEALANLKEENYEETCLYLLKQKLQTLKDTDLIKKKAKLFRFATGRGFGFDIVSKCLSRLLSEAATKDDHILFENE